MSRRPRKLTRYTGAAAPAFCAYEPPQISLPLFVDFLRHPLERAKPPLLPQRKPSNNKAKLPEAEQAWRKITDANPKDAAAFASLGLVLSRQGKYEQAVPAYQRANSLNPQLPGIHLNWGLAEFKQQHFEAALIPLGTALKADPQNLQVRTLLGLSAYGAKHFADAVTYLELPAKADPSNIELHRVLAQSCLSAKQYDCALAEFRQILERDPDSAAAHMLSGEALDGLGRTVEAIPELKPPPKPRRAKPNVHFGLGYLYWKQHKYEEAETAFKAELGIDPRHAQAMAYLGDIELKQNAPRPCSSPAQQSHATAKRYPHRLPGHRRHSRPTRRKIEKP